MSDRPIILLNNEIGSPSYRQISDQFLEKIQNGELKPGDKIPTERDLAQNLKIARGTVKRAYEELIRKGVLQSEQGRGTFVCSSAPEMPLVNRKEKAVYTLRRALDDLTFLKFSLREIRTLVELELLSREKAEEEPLLIAAVDCNPEALQIYERQLHLLPNVRIVKFLLPELSDDAGAESRLSPFVLILTTLTHFHELSGRFPGLSKKLLQVAVAPSQETIIRLAKLSPTRETGIFCESNQFAALVKYHLESLHLLPEHIHVLSVSDKEGLAAKLPALSALIIPSYYAFAPDKTLQPSLQAFTEKGGNIISFDYVIDRGSLLHVEERLARLLTESD
ncbi:MAG: hypothetical protein A2293_03870 [Elusimicrobia bacterium RIFOXYB2_FULL_49_7]|nr:MAG: hypothetical protein A2293_03870 [Elusimicrobia bacterium RIFOXYB2_FULL_49_7]